MAKYRMIRVSFWEDARVLEEMTPEDKYFYMYLMTNPNTTQIGIYQLTKKKIVFETGYSSETIQVLMDRFENIHKLIKYNKETREIALLNWPKYNLVSAGKPILDCVKAELAVVKDVSLIHSLISNIPNDNVKSLFSEYAPLDFDEPYHEPSTAGGQKEKEKEKENKKEKEHISDLPSLESQFTEWWNVYNKRKDKPKALAAFKRIVKRDGYDILLEKTKLYVSGFSNPNDKFKRHPTTFLNNFDVDNDYTPEQKGGNSFEATQQSSQRASNFPGDLGF